VHKRGPASKGEAGLSERAVLQIRERGPMSRADNYQTKSGGKIPRKSSPSTQEGAVERIVSGREGEKVNLAGPLP